MKDFNTFLSEGDFDDGGDFYLYIKYDNGKDGDYEPVTIDGHPDSFPNLKYALDIAKKYNRMWKTSFKSLMIVQEANGKVSKYYDAETGKPRTKKDFKNMTVDG